MQKRLWLIFAFYFLFSSVGTVYGSHACGKRESRTIWGFSVSAANACSCNHKSDAHRKNCCSSSAKWLKADTDHSRLHIFLLIQDPAYLAVTPFYTFRELHPAAIIPLIFLPAGNSPPGYRTPPYLRFRAILV